MRSNTGWAKHHYAAAWCYFINGTSLCGWWRKFNFVPEIPVMGVRCAHCERKRVKRGEDGEQST